MQAGSLTARWTATIREPRFAACLDNRGYPASPELHKIYRVLPDDDAAAEGDLRAIDESGEDYFYSASRFVEIEPPQTVRRSLLHASRAAWLWAAVSRLARS